MKICIKNACIATLVPENPVVEGNLLIENDSIAYIGPKAFGADTVIDAAGAIVLPGLVNAHTHLSMTLFRSFAAGYPLQEWLEKVWAVEDRLTEEDAYAGALLACAESLLAGTATVHDMYMQMEGVAKACAESGIRAVLGRTLLDAPGGLAGRLAEAEALHKNWHGFEGRITVNAALHAEYTASETAYKQALAMARRLGQTVHVHAAETVRESAECRGRHGISPIEFIVETGLCAQPVLAAHCVAVTTRDIALMKEHNIVPVHNPASNLKLASGIAPVPDMLAAGIPVALGTDGACSNDGLDMFREMHLAAILHKGATRNAAAVTPFQAVSMATANGGRALRLPTGVLAPGNKADVLVLQKGSNLQVIHDVYAAVCYTAGAQNVRYNIINGRAAVAEGRLCFIQEEKAGRLAALAKKRLFETL